MTCPACGAERPVPILYGLPADPGVFEAVERGEVVLGGCMVREDSPQWACAACSHRWGEG